MTGRAFVREVSRRTRFVLDRVGVFRANRRTRRSLPAAARLPAEPWRIDWTASVDDVARLPAGPLQRVVVPTAYRAEGAPRTEWPLADGVPGFEVRVRSAANAVVLPRHVALDATGKLLPLSLDQGNEALIRVPLVGGYIFRDRLPADPVGHIDRPVFVADTCWAHVYGHLLLEILPMLLLQREAPDDAVVLTTAPLSRTLFVAAETLGVPRHRLRRIAGPLRCSHAYWADLLSRHDGSVHPLMWTAYERLRGLASGSEVSRPERVFISRSGVRSRRLHDEGAVEDLFAQRGFAIVHPEQLPIEDQIAIFASAKLIAGLGGSGMHNAVFASADTPVLIVQTGNMGVKRDMALSPLTRRLGYVFGKTDPFGEPFTASWSVDPSDVVAGIKGHFQL